MEVFIFLSLFSFTADRVRRRRRKKNHVFYLSFSSSFLTSLRANFVLDTAIEALAGLWGIFILAAAAVDGNNNQGKQRDGGNNQTSNETIALISVFH